MPLNIYIAVINDLVTDQRVHRTASVLHSAGTKVCLVGRKLPESPDPGERPYQTFRLKLLFKKGFLFYAFFNVRLLLYLLTRKKTDIIVANDLDTLPSCFLASKLRRAKLVYDSHEFFTEVPELEGRGFVKFFWGFIEKLLVPRLKLAYTVNDSIAGIYSEKYGTYFHVVRNIPSMSIAAVSFRLPDEAEGKKIVIYQGAVNKGRGIEQVILAVKSLENVIFIIAGNGDVMSDIRNIVRQENLDRKVLMTGRIKPEELLSLTSQAHLGVSCELNMGLNYYYALPNKLFSYIHAGIPVLTTSFPEMKNIVETYDVGMTIDDPEDTETLRRMIHTMLHDEKMRLVWKKNTVKAAAELSWECEQKRLQNIYNRVGIDFNQH